MNVGSLSTALSQISLKGDVSINLMKKSMDCDKQNADNMTKMMEKCAIDPNRGQKLDVKA